MMGRNAATLNYGLGSLFGNTVNMYIFGSAILTTWNFIIGLFVSQSFDEAVNVAVDYYINKLTPFPVDEFLTASGFHDVALNIGLAIGLGVLVASYRYRNNRY